MAYYMRVSGWPYTFWRFYTHSPHSVTMNARVMLEGKSFEYLQKQKREHNNLVFQYLVPTKRKCQLRFHSNQLTCVVVCVVCTKVNLRQILCVLKAFSLPRNGVLYIMCCCIVFLYILSSKVVQSVTFSSCHDPYESEGIFHIGYISTWNIDKIYIL